MKIYVWHCLVTCLHYGWTTVWIASLGESLRCTFSSICDVRAFNHANNESQVHLFWAPCGLPFLHPSETNHLPVASSKYMIRNTNHHLMWSGRCISESIIYDLCLLHLYLKLSQVNTCSENLVGTHSFTVPPWNSHGSTHLLVQCETELLKESTWEWLTKIGFHVFVFYHLLQ